MASRLLRFPRNDDNKMAVIAKSVATKQSRPDSEIAAANPVEETF
jgi:hypothetical protein